jgi:hypothetical protein
MPERQWELYRLSVVETWPDSPFKVATIAGIQHKLAAIENAEGARHGTRGDWRDKSGTGHSVRRVREF